MDSGAGYQSLPQAPTDPNDHTNTTLLRRSLELEDDEELLAESIITQEVQSTADSRIRWVHFVLGCAVLLPWNAIITATPFFLSRLEGSSLKSTFSSYLSTSFTISNFIFLAHATATSDQATTARRTLLSILTLTVLTFMFTVSTFITTSPGIYFAFVILNGVAQAAAGSYLQTSVIAVASLFGPTAMQALFSGQAAVGVAVSAIQVISSAASVGTTATAEQLAESKPEERSAFIFFGISTIFLLFSAAAHAWLIRLPSYKAVVGQFSHIRHRSRGETGASLEDSILSVTSLLSTTGPKVDSAQRRTQIIRVAKSNIVYNLAVAYVFVITLSVFPPITISIVPTNPATHPLLFSAVHFLVFNVGDFTGRTICSYPRLLVWSSRRLSVFSFARTLFIPIFLLCNIQRGGSSTAAPAFINSDIIYMLILLTFGATNGYVSTLLMMSASSVEHNPYLRGRVEDVDVAATVASFFLIGGLALGSFASFAVRAAICDCNPFRD
ncbi:nucleoside transporter-domain-containing protein [Cristinia sonorae]|uniref:Nucleoside transporter-domain-containing protein n=1 Tax=Cristinia sonorae TaxID=1940300 RepID=A0A8K0XTY5_9AGAR|nr:nucleoside transporter-domain-containing protein [Cristinia sonorae]